MKHIFPFVLLLLGQVRMAGESSSLIILEVEVEAVGEAVVVEEGVVAALVVLI